MNQTQLLRHFESEDIMDQEQLHRDALKGLMMLSETPLNPDAKEWEPKRQPRTFHHLRGKMMKRLKRCEYFRSKKLLCDVDTDIIMRSVNDFLDSNEFKDNIEHQARIMAIHSNEKPKWETLKTNMLKGMFALFYKDGRISENLSRPLSKYSRNQFIEFLDKYWKPLSVVDVEEDICAICYETMTQETPKTQLMCKHTLCTSCFLQCCRHNGNMLICNCPLCRAPVR